MARRAGYKKASTRGLSASVLMPTSRPAVAHQACARVMGRSPRWVGTTVQRTAAPIMVIPSTPPRRVIRPVRREGRSKARPEGLARPPEHGDESQGGDRLDDVAVTDEVQGHGSREEQDRDQPGRALAPPHASGEGEKPDTGEGDEGAGGFADSEGDVAEERMEPSTDLRRHDRRDEVGQAEDGDAERGEPPDPAQGSRRIGEAGPHEAARVGGDHHGRGRAPREAAGRETLQQSDRGQVPAGEQESCVHLGTGFYLHPGDLPDVDEDRGQPEARFAFFDDLAAGTGVRIKAGADPRQLGLQGVARDETDAPVLEDGPRRPRGRCRWRGARGVPATTGRRSARCGG